MRKTDLENSSDRIQNENATVRNVFEKMTLQEVIEYYLECKSEQEQISLDEVAPVRLLDAITELDEMFPEPVNIN